LETSGRSSGAEPEIFESDVCPQYKRVSLQKFANMAAIEATAKQKIVKLIPALTRNGDEFLDETRLKVNSLFT